MNELRVCTKCDIEQSMDQYRIRNKKQKYLLNMFMKLKGIPVMPLKYMEYFNDKVTPAGLQ